jgi:hypothetical protein
LITRGVLKIQANEQGKTHHAPFASHPGPLSRGSANRVLKNLAEVSTRPSAEHLV